MEGIELGPVLKNPKDVDGATAVELSLQLGIPLHPKYVHYYKALNRDELLANLRRFYPEVERRAGREGAVRVKLHIGADGKVDPVEISFSGGTAFDIAAREVGRRMRFSPAIGLDGSPVPVGMPQDILFRLED